MFWNNFSFKKLAEKGLINMNKGNKFSSVKKILIGGLLLGVIGSISLMFIGVQNIIIFIVEKAVLGRSLNNLVYWHSQLKKASILGVFSCFSLIAMVLFAKKLISGLFHKKNYELSSVQKVLIGILLLGVFGSILLMFNGVQNIIIFIVEKAVFGRPLNYPDNAHLLLANVSFWGIFSCFSLALVLFVQKYVNGLVRQPDWLLNKSCSFSAYGLKNCYFFKVVVQKLKFLNNSNIVKTLFVLCGTVLAVASSTQQIGFIMEGVGNEKGLAVRWLFVIALFTLAGLSVLVFKYHFLENTYDKFRGNSKIVQVLFMVFAMLCAGSFVGNFYNHAYMHVQHLHNFPQWWFHLLYAYGKAAEPFPFTPPQWILSVVLFIPVTVFYAYLSMGLVDVFKCVFSTLTASERRFLIIGSIIAIIYIVLIYNLSNVFYAPNSSGTGFIWNNVLYSADSGAFWIGDLFENIYHPENDLRQPIFSVFTIPFAIIAKILTRNNWVIPITIIQLELLLFGNIILSRLVAAEKDSLIFNIFISSTFPYLIFSTFLEQYNFVLFWLILLIYSHIKYKERNLWFASALGSLSTNGILLPLLIKNKKTWLVDIFKGCMVYLLIATSSGRVNYLINWYNQFNSLKRFGGQGLTFHVKFLQLTNFIHSCLFAPASSINNVKFAYPSWQMLPVTSVNVIGVIIIIIAIVGFLLNYRQRIAQIAFLWVVFSFFILCVFGWGSRENGMVLYVLYFSWAYISLIYMAIDKLFGDKNKEKAATLLVLVGMCLAVNGKAIIEILRFGIEFYPVR